MKYHLLLFCFVVLSSLQLIGQEVFIKGIIKDSVSQNTLSGVAVMLDDSKGTYSNKKGKFSIKALPGKHLIKVSLIGYGEKESLIEIEEGKDKEISIYLTYIETELDVVVISSSLYEKNIAEETVSMEVISGDVIQKSNAKELGEALSRGTGVQVQDGQITIRGGSSYSYGIGSRTAVMVDGPSMMSADLGDPQLKLTAIETADQIEIIKGSSSVVYGSSALNGVVNVRTRWPKSDKPITHLNVYSGIYNAPKRDTLIWYEGYQPSFGGMFFTHEQKIGNLSIIGGANIRYVNSYLEDITEHFVRGNIKTRYTSKKNPGLNYGLNVNLMKETGRRFFLAQDFYYNSLRPENSSPDSYFRTQIDPHLSYLDEENGHKYTLKGRYLNVWRKGNGDDINASSNAVSIDNQYQKTFTLRNIGERPANNRKFILTTGIPLNFGISKSNLYENSGSLFTLSAAAYAQAEYKTNRLSLVGGVRYEISQQDTVFEATIPVFRTGINYRAGKASYFRASWGQGYRIPSIGERFVEGSLIIGLANVCPNPNLQIEKNWSAEFGFKQGFKIDKWKGFVDIAFFWQEYENFVEYRFEPIDLFNVDSCYYSRDDPSTDFVLVALRPENLENARVAGYEISMGGKGTIGSIGVQGGIGYTYTYPINIQEDPSMKNLGNFLNGFFSDMFVRLDSAALFNGQDSSRLLQFRTRHLLRGDLEFAYNKFSFGTTLIYNSFPERIPATFETAIGIIDGSISSSSGQPTQSGSTLDLFLAEHQRGDFIINIRTSYQLNDRLEIGFIINNLFNREYAVRPSKIEPPRDFTLRLNATL